MDIDQSSEMGGSKNVKEKNEDEERSSDKITFRSCPEFRKEFIELYLEQVNDVGYMGSSLRAPPWEKMGKILSEKYKCPMPYKKLRNHWDYLKKQYVMQCMHTTGALCVLIVVPGIGCKDFRSRGRARGKEEIFNHAHARLRNVIERTFGVLKARFPILKTMPPYSLETQRDIVVACMVVHNFLREVLLNDMLFQQYEDGEIEISNAIENDVNVVEPPPNLPHMFGREEQNYMINLCDQIANELLSQV